MNVRENIQAVLFNNKTKFPMSTIPVWFGKGITFEAFGEMECSAIPYLVEDLDAGDEKNHSWGQHSGDLVDKGLVQLHIQQRQYGLGCIDSWMTKPMEKYRMHYADREFSFKIKARK